VHLDPAAPEVRCTGTSSLPERERETSFAREPERDPASPAPLPGHVNKEVEKTWPGNEDEDHAA